MKVAIFDVDSKIPNLALMKFSAYHKSLGDSIEWYSDLWALQYDLVYCSKVFTWTTKPSILSNNIVYGGSGWSLVKKLPKGIEHIMPDYDLYGRNYSMGFTTRGCPRSCEFCVVPKKEGKIRDVADIYEFWHPSHKSLVLLDNNIFASKGQFEKISEQILKEGLKIDFNQGLDIRLLTLEKVKILKQLKPMKQWRFAFDSLSYEEQFRRGAEMLIEGKIPKNKICIYILAGFDDSFNDVLKRVSIVYEEYEFDPFIMLYRPVDGGETQNEEYNKLKTISNMPAWKKYKSLARYVNHKAIFKSVAWQDYK